MTALLFAACAAPDAEPGSVVLPPPDAAEPWDEAYTDDDDIGGRFPMEAVVIGPDGAPAVGVRVSVLSGWDGASVRLPGSTAVTTVLDVRTNEVIDLGPCGGGATDCTWLELVSSGAGRISFDVFVDVAPNSGGSVPVFISAGGDVASVEIEFVDALVVH
ncbi:MAG: hypothetical protein EXR71_13060 [Myxococcales bacterium]|nr:hypothetical protein [Myxococcales bacterium]